MSFLLNKEQNVQECDERKFNSSNVAKYKIILNLKQILLSS